MTKTIASFVCFICFFAHIYAQDSLSKTTPIEDGFKEVIEGSNSYQGYKVVDYDKLTSLKSKTTSYITELKNEITSKENTVSQQQEEINALKETLEDTKANLKKVNDEKDAIMFLGMPFSKGSYMALMWGIVAVLILALLFFIYKFKNSNAVTKEAKKRLQDTEKNFDAYKTKSLEKEQRLGRLLQDEKNKASNY